MPEAQTAYIHNAMLLLLCWIVWFAFTHRPAIHKHSTYVLSCAHIPTSTAVCSRIVHLKRKFRSPSSYIANNNPTLMNRHLKIKETNILLHRYFFLKITNSSSIVNKKPFEIKLKQILYSDPFGLIHFLALMPTTMLHSIHLFSSDHILFPSFYIKQHWIERKCVVGAFIFSLL